MINLIFIQVYSFLLIAVCFVNQSYNHQSVLYVSSLKSY